MIFKTPSGCEVELKDFMTFGQRRSIEKLVLSKTKINPQTQQLSEIDPAILYETQDQAFKILVLSIKDKDGIKIEGDLFDFVNELPEADGQAIFAKINEISNPKVEKKS